MKVPLMTTFIEMDSIIVDAFMTHFLFFDIQSVKIPINWTDYCVIATKNLVF